MFRSPKASFTIPGVERQDLVQRDRQGPRIDLVFRACVVVRHTLPNAISQARQERGSPPAGAGVLAPADFSHQRSRGLGHVADERHIYALVGADRIGVVVDLNHRRSRIEQPTVAGGPHVERHAGAQHHVGLGDQLGRGRRGETARNAE